jgi:hypothetical protein
LDRGLGIQKPLAERGRKSGENLARLIGALMQQQVATTKIVDTFRARKIVNQDVINQGAVCLVKTELSGTYYEPTTTKMTLVVQVHFGRPQDLVGGNKMR